MLSPRRRGLIGAFVCVLATAVVPVLAQQPLLNSERIEQTFGSYGIEVIHSDAELRVSNLYSEHDGQRITRTLAMVAYPAAVHRTIRAEHETILAGGSIGATFQQNGWTVVKTEHRFLDYTPPDFVAGFMNLDGDAELALHVYRLSVERRRRQFDYALIIEAHHPEYLRREELEQIYGPASGPGLGSEGGDLLLRGLRVLGGRDLSLGE